MHSVKKVEEKARIAREEKRKKKMIEMDAVRKQIFSLSKYCDGNERTVLDLTEAVLTQIPDIYTFWVIRRDVLMHVKTKMETDQEFSILSNDEAGRIFRRKEADLKKEEKKAKEIIEVEVLNKTVDESLVSDPEATAAMAAVIGASGDADKQEDEDKSVEPPKAEEKPIYPRPSFFDLVDREITFTETALFANPKSYSAWNHRRWAIELHEDPPLDRELIICEKALTFDCRNFHVWDYRRFIVRLLKRTMEQELEFVNEMVKKNPSNYSAWHYRISLLLESGERITDDMFDAELRGVTENCVVNSEDQTAWTYVNWLIETFAADPKPAVVPDHLVSFTDNAEVNGKKHSTFVFISAVSSQFVQDYYLDGAGYELKPRFTGSSFESFTVAYIWDVYSSSDVNLLLKKEALKSNWSVVDTPRRRYVNMKLLRRLLSQEPRDFSEKVKETFKFFYETCQELMKENQEANPWEIIAQAHVLPIIKGVDENIENEVNQLLEKAKTADPQRCELYDAMKDKCAVINMVHKKLDDGKTVLDALAEKEGKVLADFNDYSTLRLLAGLIRVAERKGEDHFNPQLKWFVPVQLLE